MWYLTGSILLNALGFFLSSHSYTLQNAAWGYIMGTASSVVFLMSFLLLEYALFSHDFSSIFSTWTAGTAAVFASAGIYFWGEQVSGLQTLFVMLTLLGMGGMMISHKKPAFKSRGNQ